jgi:hypothetical protein
MSHVLKKILLHGVVIGVSGLSTTQAVQAACSDKLTDSYFYNPDFEAYSQLPTDWSYPSLSQVDRLNNWHQTTEGTTDFWHDKGVKNPNTLSPSIVGSSAHLLPYSSTTTAGGAVGFITSKTLDFAEYVGQCLKAPLKAGTNYRLRMRVGYLDNTGSSTGGDVSGHLIALGRTSCPATIPLAGSDNKEGDAGYTLLGATAINHQWESGWQTIEMELNSTSDMPYIMFGLRKSTLVAERDNAYAIVDELVLNERTCVPSKLTTEDYGDAPSTYGTPSHTVLSTVRMGALVDAEPTHQASTDAKQDNNVGSVDEDGVTLPAQLVPNVTTNISINVTGANGYLSGWIDWNRDGDFLDIGEQVVTNLQDNKVGDTNAATGTISFALTPPSDLQLGTSYARFRWSTSSGLAADTGVALNGEIEDYAINLEKYLPIINSANTCSSSGGTDVLFLLDNSGSVDGAEYTNFAANVVSAGNQLLSKNPGIRIAVGHYAGDMFGITQTPGQNIYFERDFSTATVNSPIRQFGAGTSYPDFTSDNTSAALYQASFGLDNNASTTSSLIVSPVKELARDLTRPLQVVIFTDAIRYEHAGSTLIDIDTQGFDPDDGSNFTVYNKFKAQGVKFSVVAYPVDAFYEPVKTQASAAIASKGGAYTGTVEANNKDPEGSATTPRRLIAGAAGFILSATQLVELVTPVADACPTVMDFGDAPASYGSAGQAIASGYYLGTVAPDSESTYIASATASNDDSTGTDDEDGMTLPSLVRGQTATLSAKVNGVGGYLQGWIDWNGDGDFVDAGEQVATNLQDGGALDTNASTGTISFSVIVPTNAALNTVSTPTFARFRWSTTANLTSSGNASVGEVEDYGITVEAMYPPVSTPAVCNWSTGQQRLFAHNVSWTHNEPKGTLASSIWSPSVVASAEPVVVGAGILYEQPYATATEMLVKNAATASASAAWSAGDYITHQFTTTADVETTDFFNILSYGQFKTNNYNYRITVLLAENPAFTNAVELLSNYLVANPSVDGFAQVQISTAKTVYAKPSTTYYLRVLFYNVTNPSTGVSWDDFAIGLNKCMDYGDSATTYGDAAHKMPANDALRLGTTAPDAENNTLSSADASGDDISSPDDEDGVTLPALTLGKTSTITATVSGANGYLQGWLDWNGDGDFADAGEQIATNLQDNQTGDTNNAVGTIAFNVSVPFTAVTKPTYARFRWSSTQNLDSLSTVGNGEVEDYSVTLIEPPTSVVLSTPASYQLCKSTSVEQLDTFNYAVAKGSGATGVPSLTYTAPTGSNRLMVVLLSFERDHLPLARGDNFETNPAVTFPTVTFGGVPLSRLAHSIYSIGSSNSYSDAELSRSYYLYVLFDLSIPTGAQTLQVSDINTPTSAGDEAILAVTTFANAAGIDPVSSNSVTSYPFALNLAVSPVLDAPADQPPGTTSADNLLLAFGTSTKSENLTIGSTWKKLAEIPAINTAGTFGTSTERSNSVYSENDGHTLVIQAIKGVTTPQTAHFSSVYNSLFSLNGHVFRVTAHGCDYGDAPASYGEASHSQSWSRRLGAQRGDAETSTPTAANATGDNLNQVADEDGVTIPTLTAGQPANITATVAGVGYLSAWFDWNGDGDFSDANEQVLTSLQDNTAGDNDSSAGNIVFSIMVPSNAVTTPTYARFRWSMNTGIAASGFGSYGEVEDYALTIKPSTNAALCSSEADLDALFFADSGNSKIYRLDNISGTPTNILTSVMSLPVGTSNGLTISKNLHSPTPSPTFYAAIMSSGTIYYHYYDGTQWVATGHKTSEPSTSAANPGGGVEYIFNYAGNHGQVWRYDGKATPTTPLVTVTNGVTQSIYDLATDNQDNFYLYKFNEQLLYKYSKAGVLLQTYPTNNAVTGSFPGFAIVKGKMYITVGDITPEIYRGELVGGSIVFTKLVTLSLPVGAKINDLAACPTVTDPLPNNTSDYSDAPSSYGVATHLINNSVYLGYTVPDSDNGIFSLDGTGDDISDSDDEEGVVLPSNFTKGQVATVSAKVVGAGGYLSAWVDWNGDGDFADADEQIIQDVQDGGVLDTDASTGVIGVKVTPPTSLVKGNSYARFRWSTTAGLGNKGGATSGEVEDYAVVLQDIAVAGVKLNVKALLQGPYAVDTGLMADNLRSLSLIPITQPYGKYSLFNYQGNETLSTSRLSVTGSAAIVDWVLVELRDATNPNSIVSRQAALLTRDGSIVSASTNNNDLVMPNVVAGNYYVVIRHRNHLGVMTKTPIALSSMTSTSVDFRLKSTPTYSTNARLERDIDAILWAGNANLNRNIIANGPENDASTVLSSILVAKGNELLNTNYILTGYLNSDLDLSGAVIFSGPDNDINILVGNVLLHPNNSTFSGNYVISDGLPQ